MSEMLVELLCVFLFNAFLTANIGTVDAAIRKTRLTGMNVDEFCESLPTHVRQPPHQAGGHRFNERENELGILEDTENGLILKSLDGSEQAATELKLYEDVQNGYQPKFADLIPKFHGIVSFPYRDTNVEFIAMENLAHGFVKPCVMDLKMGKITWLPNDDQEKIDRHKAKHKVKDEYGFAMSGCRFTNLQTNEEKVFTREECKTVDSTTLVEAMENFVHTSGDSRATVALVKCIIRQLKPILKWASTQKELRLIASSIIILYDAEELPKLLHEIEENPNHETHIARVKIVDFSYAYKAPDNERGIDTNFLMGAEYLMKIFKSILTKHKLDVKSPSCGGLVSSLCGKRG